VIGMARLREAKGMTLIELLIAMTVMAVGVAALIAGLSSGILAIQRGSNASVAGALADKQMESYRMGSFSSLTVTPQFSSTSTGSDGKTYWMGTTVSWTCIVGPDNTTTSSPAPTCSGSPASRPVKLVSILVRDTTSTGKILAHEASTFDASTG
jgi:prepilin-type N-terminal cleavage/methylation domain-containing protein